MWNTRARTPDLEKGGPRTGEVGTSSCSENTGLRKDINIAGAERGGLTPERASPLYTSATAAKRGKNDRRTHLHVIVHGLRTRDVSAPDNKKPPPGRPLLPLPSPIHHHTLYPSPQTIPPPLQTTRNGQVTNGFVIFPSEIIFYTLLPPPPDPPSSHLDPTETRTRTARKATTEKRTRKGTILRAYILVFDILFTDSLSQSLSQSQRRLPVPTTSL